MQSVMKLKCKAVASKESSSVSLRSKFSSNLEVSFSMPRKIDENKVIKSCIF